MPKETFMRRAITLALRGQGHTNPNPMVGAVIVRGDTIIGEGWHEKCGELHAERNALAHCTQDPRGATIYVTLEPCCHYGRTPPCTEALIQAGISEVIIGSRDPNPKVAGKGVQQLRDAGISVTEDYLRAECDAINPIFFHYITTGLPYVALKYAMTADGKIATVTGASRWVSGEAARKHSHTLRNVYSSILVGIGTVLADNPLLNCRIEGGKDPMRIICDSHLRLPTDSQICQTAKEIPTLVACTQADPARRAAIEACGAEVLVLPEHAGHVDLRALCEELGKRKIDSVFAEGGGEIHYSLLQTGMVHKIYAYLAPKIFGGAQAKTPVSGAGVLTPQEAFSFAAPSVTPLGEDILLEFEKK